MKRKNVIFLIILFLVVGFLCSCSSFSKKKLAFNKLLESQKYDSVSKICYGKTCSGFIAKNKDKKTLLNNNMKIPEINNIEDFYKNNIIAFGDKYLIYYSGDDYFVLDNTKFNRQIYKVDDFLLNSDKVYVTRNRVYTDDNQDPKIDYKKMISIPSLKSSYFFDGIAKKEINKTGYFIGTSNDGSSTIVDFGGKNLSLKEDKYAVGFNDLNNNRIIIKRLKEDKNKNLQNDGNYIYDLKKKKKIGKEFKNYSISYSNSSQDKVLVMDNNSDDSCKTYNLRTNKIKKCNANEKLAINKDIIAFNLGINGSKKAREHKYSLDSLSTKYKGQNGVIVYKWDEQSCGILDIKTNKYKKILSNLCNKMQFKYGIDKTNIHYLVIANYKDGNNKSFVYDLMDNKKIYELDDTTYNIDDYQVYENNWKTISMKKRNANSYKHIIYDSKNQEIKSSDKSKYVLVNKSPNIGYDFIENNEKYNINNNIYYDVNKNKEIISNKHQNIIYRKENMHLISDGKTIYILNLRTGKIIKNIKGKLLKVDDYGFSYTDNNENKLYYLDFENDKVSNYNLDKDEKPYNQLKEFVGVGRGNFFINNLKNKTAKIINAKGKVLKEYKDSIIINTHEFYDFVIIELENTKTHLKQLIRVE